METENRDRKYERKQGNKKSIRKPRDSRRVDNTFPKIILKMKCFFFVETWLANKDMICVVVAPPDLSNKLDAKIVIKYIRVVALTTYYDQ